MERNKLLIIKVNKKYVSFLKLVMLAVAIPFLLDVYDLLATGIADTGRYTSIRGEDWGYYAYLFKKLAFLSFFLWMGSFGILAKSNDE